MSLDLNKLANKLANKLDEALIKETTESLTKFLNDKRMENNKQQTAVKLYTEEQLIQAIKWAQKCDHDCGGVYFYYETSNDILEDLTPIELPSDDEIEKANPFVFGSKHLGTRDMDIWRIGAQWMRDKIQGGNK